MDALRSIARALDRFLFPGRIRLELPYAETRRRLRALRAQDIRRQRREVRELERMVDATGATSCSEREA